MQAASVGGQSNQELKLHLAVGGGVSVWVSVAARRSLTPNAFGFQTHSWHKPQPGVRARFLQGVYNPNSRKATSVGRRDVVAEESTVQLELTLTLPASLAREAEDQGLLTSPMLEALLRAEVQRRRVAQLFDAADRLAALPLAPLSEAEVEAEIHAVRAERRATRARGH